VAVDAQILSLITDVEQIISSLDTQAISHREGEIRQALTRLRAYLLSQQALSSPNREQLEAQITNSLVTAITRQINRVFADGLQALQEQQQQLQAQHQGLLRDIEQLIQLESLMSGLNQQFQTLQQQEFSASQSLHLIQEYRQQSEQALLQLDNSFKNVFANLEKDLQGYYQSLFSGLEKLNNLGQQGEAQLIEYLQHLSVHLPPENLPSPSISTESWYLGL
jgi:uncharacterized phage infection (PIP) family protein YhgE